MVLQLDPKERGKGRLIVNPKGVAFGRQYRLGRQGAWWEVPLDVKLGVSYTGGCLVLHSNTIPARHRVVPGRLLAGARPSLRQGHPVNLENLA